MKLMKSEVALLLAFSGGVLLFAVAQLVPPIGHGPASDEVLAILDQR
jgi:hypothetical protein